MKRLLGAILLVAGCCIGAGMLGLPLVTIQAGFWPSLIAFIISWLFMVSTGLLLLEANLFFGQGVHLMTLAEKTLGKGAKYLVAFTFAFLFYCLMVAYIAGGGVLVSDASSSIFGFSIDPTVGSLAITLIFGFIVFLGSKQVDMTNRLMMIGLGISYFGLVFLGVQQVKASNLLLGAWQYAVPALPTMIISFGFHNLVPSLTDYLKGNASHLRIAIIVGSIIPLIVYVLWNGIILGILPSDRNMLSQDVDSGAMVTSLLREAVGQGYVVELLQTFAFLALATSFLAVALSFVDFLADGLSVKKTKKGALLLISLILLPSLFFSYIYPGIFLSALNYAGAFGAVILFGIFPVLMAWKGRYYTHQFDKHQLPGGKFVLVLLGCFSVFVFFMQLLSELL